MYPLLQHINTYPGATPEMTEALMGLAKETKARGWWHSYGDAIPGWFELYVGLESAASRLRWYDPELIPGLLQTKAYTTEVYQVHNPGMAEAELERSVAVRIGRQALLTRKVPSAPRIDFILNEPVLRRPTADRAAMARQLHHINEVSKLPNVSVRVLPLNAGLHRAMTCGYFAVLDFPQNGSREAEPSIVYSDNLTGALYLDKPQEIDAYSKVWYSVHTASLTDAQSKKLITAIAEEYSSP
jgi:hypothetical protein